jgi:hypothetical protein
LRRKRDVPATKPYVSYAEYRAALDDVYADPLAAIS